MEFYLAPMEAVTGFVYRNVYHELFGDMDAYYTPFIAPSPKKIIKTRERKDIDPANNVGMHTIPQLLTNDAEAFIDGCRKLAERGYKEVNLNLGCPMATVVTKKKGSGFLSVPEELDRFFDGIFEELAKQDNLMAVSVKTRIGMESADEFPRLVEIYNRYPIQQLIVHPRTREDFYGNTPDMEAFLYAFSHVRCPVCYNGDIFSAEDYQRLLEACPDLTQVMLGRGIIANPGLVREIKTGKKTTPEEFMLYHDKLFEGYMNDLGSFKDVLFKMKELWFYLSKNCTEPEKGLKKIRKASSESQYREAVRMMQFQ